jgi:HK97 family phage portal protein
MGLTDNIRGFFRQQGSDTEQKSYGQVPTSQIVFPFNTDAGFYSGVNQMSPEGNSAALACLNVLGTAFSEPPLEVYVKTDEGLEYIPNHPASELLKNPNPNMSSNLLNNYIMTSVAVYGDAFLLKLKNESGSVVQLIPLLPDMVEVKGNNEQLITKYEYKQKGNTLSIPPEDMIHLRERIDPRNHRRGLAPLRSVMVEVLGDAAASQMGAALVKNTGVPSVVISPKNDLSMTSDEAENIAEVFGRRFGGENRGRPLVISGGEVDIQTLSFSPKDLEIGKLRYINEERISAVLGVPAILAGLGSGLERATYSNVRELREFFTEQKLIPTWNHFANEFTKQLLLQDYESDPKYCFKYDLTDVRALSQDEDATMHRITEGFNAGFVTVNEARTATQLPPLDNGDYFVRGMTLAEVPTDGGEVTMYHNGSGTETEYSSDEETVEIKEDLKEDIEVKVEKVPSYIQKNAKRGLDLLEYAGDGLTDKTKREAREMANGKISDSKVVRMAAWFSRHEGDLDSEKADDYLEGRSDKPTAGQVAWLLWGGDISKSNKMRAYNWANKEAEKVKEEKSVEFDLYGWEEPTTKFLGLPTVKHYKSEQDKKELWKAINNLENVWMDYMSNVYGKELNRQRRGLSKVARGSIDLQTLQTNVDIFLDNSKFDKELLPLFYSIGDDFTVRTYDNLFPADDNFKQADPVDLDVRIDPEETVRTVFTTVAALLPEGRSIKKVVENGFYRGQREVPVAARSLFEDGQAAGFIQENAKKVMNDLNNTTKKRIATIIEKTIKEFEELGIVNPIANTPNGDKFFNQLAKDINTVLGGQNLGRAKTIARTEVGKVSSWSQERAAKSTGKTLEKEWLSERDDKVRSAHFELDNQRVPLNSFYLYNGIKLDRPRDPNAPIGLIANCRCSETYIEVIDE